MTSVWHCHHWPAPGSSSALDGWPSSTCGCAASKSVGTQSIPTRIGSALVV